VQPDYVVCLECGFRAKTLRRHLRMHHGLEVGAYRARWKLPTDHPTTAPAYSERRSAMAKQLGLGRKPGSVEPLPAPGGGVGRASQPLSSGPWGLSDVAFYSGTLYVIMSFIVVANHYLRRDHLL
jgi:hypothetical protein